MWDEQNMMTEKRIEQKQNLIYIKHFGYYWILR